MTQFLANNRPFFETLILDQLQELKGMETGLKRQFASLRMASPKTRAPFVQKLADLNARAIRLERLIDALEEDGATSAKSHSGNGQRRRWIS